MSTESTLYFQAKGNKLAILWTTVTWINASKNVNKLNNIINLNDEIKNKQTINIEPSLHSARVDEWIIPSSHFVNCESEYTTQCNLHKSQFTQTQHINHTGMAIIRTVQTWRTTAARELKKLTEKGEADSSRQLTCACAPEPRRFRWSSERTVFIIRYFTVLCLEWFKFIG